MRERIRNRHPINNGTTSSHNISSESSKNIIIEDHNLTPSESRLESQHQQQQYSKTVKINMKNNIRPMHNKLRKINKPRDHHQPTIIIGRFSIIFILCILCLVSIIAPNFVLVNQYSNEYYNKFSSTSTSSSASSVDRRNTRYNTNNNGILNTNNINSNKKRLENRWRKRRILTTPPPPLSNIPRPQGYKFEPELVANLPNFSGGALPKCSPSNIPYRILITGILSSTLSMGLALSLALQYQNINCVSIIGIDSLLPNTLERRWEYMDRLKILKKHNIPSKLLLPFTGVFPLGVTEETFRGELDKAQLTHIIHVMREDVDVSTYREVEQSLVSMEQILTYLKKGNKKTKFIYVSHSDGETGRHKALKKADEVLASTYHSMHGVSSVGVRLPSVFGPWGVARDDVLYSLTEELIRNSTLPTSPAPNEDQQMTLMSVNDAAHAVFTAMHHTTPGAVVFNTPKKTEKLHLSSLYEQMQQVWDSSPSDFNTMSKFQKALYQSVGSRYYQVYPHGPTPYEKNFANNLWHSALPVQYPCVSECAHKGYCQQTELDLFVPSLRKATKRCKYILYTDNFDEELEELTDVSKYTEDDPEYCYIVFLYQKAPFLQNATLVNKIPLVKGWITIPLPKKGLTPSTSQLIKLSPSKLFSPTIQKAMYFHTKAPPPFYVFEQILDQMETPYIPARKKWKRASDGTRYQIPIHEEPPRHVVFMSSHYNVDDNEKMLNVMDQIRALKYSEDIEENVNVGNRQYSFYEMTENLLKDKILRAPTPVEVTKELQAKGLTQPITFPLSFIRSNWMVHDFAYGKDFRCDAYHEQLFWNYDYLEDWSLMYAYAKWYGRGWLGDVEHEEFGPLINGKDSNGIGLYLRVLKKPIKIRS